jgi:hypothetical protein
MRKDHHQIALILLTIFSAYGTFAGSNEPVPELLLGTPLQSLLEYLHSGNSILFNLSVGFLVSLFFWWLLVYMPQEKKRRILRTNLTNRYKYFRLSIIQIFLFACQGSYESGLPDELLEHERFKAFFKEDKSKNWYAVLNGLEDRPDWIEEILVEMEIFSKEIDYVLNNADIRDEKVHSFFKSFESHIYKLKKSPTYSGDQVKYLGNFLWEILAHWSGVEGYRKNDVIQDMIGAI